VDKFGYKALQVIDGKLVSLYARYLNSDTVEYKLGQVIRPKRRTSPLFVYDDKDKAINRARNDSVVYRVVYKESNKRPDRDHDISIQDDSSFADELCLLYPVWQGNEVRGEFPLYKEEEDSWNSVRKVIVI
jgi:hypothetical protein